VTISTPLRKDLDSHEKTTKKKDVEGALSAHLECSFISHACVCVCLVASISVRWNQRRRRPEKKSYPSSGWATVPR
jgi:hypothetical protein